MGWEAKVRDNLICLSGGNGTSWSPKVNPHSGQRLGWGWKGKWRERERRGHDKLSVFHAHLLWLGCLGLGVLPTATPSLTLQAPYLQVPSAIILHYCLLLIKVKGEKKQEQRSAIWGQTCTLSSESAPLPGLCYWGLDAQSLARRKIIKASEMRCCLCSRKLAIQ